MRASGGAFVRTNYPRALRQDPARAHLMQLGVYSGFKGVAGQFVPISPAERDRLCEILLSEAQDLICLGCGCTKSDRWIKAMGMVACCDARVMVPAEQVIHDLQQLQKRGKPVRADMRQQWLVDEIASGRGVNRKILMRKFGCSRDTAGRDIARLVNEHPDLLVYDPSEKVHKPMQSQREAA